MALGQTTTVAKKHTICLRFQTITEAESYSQFKIRYYMASIPIKTEAKCWPRPNPLPALGT